MKHPDLHSTPTSSALVAWCPGLEEIKVRGTPRPMATDLIVTYGSSNRNEFLSPSFLYLCHPPRSLSLSLSLTFYNLETPDILNFSYLTLRAYFIENLRFVHVF
jgi:hypothetical protein